MNRKNFPGDIIWGLWAIWVVIAFTVTMLVFLVPFLLFAYFRRDPEKTHTFIRLARGWMAVFLPLAGCPLRIKGRENFQKGQTYVVVCNHNALLDVPVSYPGIPGGNKTIAKIEMAKIPLFGLIYRTGSVLVDRKDENSRRESFSKMKEVLEMGLHMCLYPEGTRNKSDKPIKEFHAGAFRLSLQSGKAIIPALIFNTRKVMPPGKTLYFKPHRLYMHFLPAVAAAPGESVDAFQQRVHDIMLDYYTRHAK